MDGKKEKTKSVVEMAHNLVADLGERAKRGEISEEEARKRAITMSSNSAIRARSISGSTT